MKKSNIEFINDNRLEELKDKHVRILEIISSNMEKINVDDSDKEMNKKFREILINISINLSYNELLNSYLRVILKNKIEKKEAKSLKDYL
mgnify:CR=1 FL=1